VGEGVGDGKVVGAGERMGEGVKGKRQRQKEREERTDNVLCS